MALFICAFALNSKAQTNGQGSQDLSAGSSPINGVNQAGQKNGSFFLIPFYEFTSFKKVALISHTNQYKLMDGEAD
jgi:hypothetical protein